MIIIWIKRILWVWFSYMVWRKTSIGTAFLFIILTIVLDFTALVIAAKLAIKGFQDGDTIDDLTNAQNRFFEYQQNPLSPSTPLVTFAQMVFAPLCSILIPVILAGWFLGWYH